MTFLPLTAEIYVNFNGSHLDLSRLRGGGKDCTTDLAAIYTELFNRMQDHGLHMTPPAENTVTWAEEVTGPDASEALGGWNPDNRAFVLRADLALVPELVRDVVAHELVHQLISEYPQPNDYDDGGHGDRFYWVSCVVSKVLRLPYPRRSTLAVWPTLDRPEGFYGPLVERRAEVLA